MTKYRPNIYKKLVSFSSMVIYISSLMSLCMKLKTHPLGEISYKFNPSIPLDIELREKSISLDFLTIY